MKLTEKQKTFLFKAFEVILFAFGMTFGLMILGFGFSMIFQLLKSLLS
jgi:hypothetical protein